MLKIALYGIGEINRLVIRALYERGLLNRKVVIEGAIDVDPTKIGRDIGEIAGLNERLGVKVESNPDAVLSRGIDVVIHATGSYLDRVYRQIVKAIRYGACVVSTCETLVWPWLKYPELAELIDAYAKARGVSVIGVGVNPGLVLDVLPALLTVTTIRLEGIKAVRSVNAALRREAFRRKLGIGLDPIEVKTKLQKGELTGHVGYAESAALLAGMTGIEIDKIEEFQEPLMAEENIESHGVKVEKGKTCGIRGCAIAYQGNRPVIQIEFKACVGCEDYDEIEIYGYPSFRIRTSGIQGDPATAAILINIALKARDFPPGLLTPRDLVRYTRSGG